MDKDIISGIKSVKNVGSFEDNQPSDEVKFSPFTLIFGENGRGKTTIVSILRSVSLNDPQLVVNRRRFGSENPPEITVEHNGTDIEFKNESWNNNLENILIFDDSFVSANVCSGMEIDSSHRKGLHELIIGEQGAKLYKKLQKHVQANDDHNNKIKGLKNEITAYERGPYEIDKFCNLEKTVNIDDKILETERLIEASESSDLIRQLPVFQDLNIPDFDDKELNRILDQDLPDIESKAVDHVKNHIAKLEQVGEKWISDGMSYVSKISEGFDFEVCPFCAQDLSGIELIEHYRGYFSDSYKKFKESIEQTIKSVNNIHDVKVQSVFRNDVNKARLTHVDWKDYLETPQIDIDCEQIIEFWEKARELVLGQLQEKLAAPLEKLTVTTDTQQAIENYRTKIKEVSELSDKLLKSNAQINTFKQKVQADNSTQLRENYAELKANKLRFDPIVNALCEKYLSEIAAKDKTKEEIIEARSNLDDYQKSIFSNYENTINKYLKKFNVNFRLGDVKSQNFSKGSTSTYNVIINDHKIDIHADSGLAFRNTLSAGDRNSLALAFFFASLDQDPDKENKIVVIDDPITSLDESRKNSTKLQIVYMLENVKQMIVLSHSKELLKGIFSINKSKDKYRKKAKKIESSTLRIRRVKDSAGNDFASEIVNWDILEDSIARRKKRIQKIKNYLEDGDSEDKFEVAEALRPTLEARIRESFPEFFHDGQMLGGFLSEYKPGKKDVIQILSSENYDELMELKDYTNQFHHDTKEDVVPDEIDENELSGYAKRVLEFAQDSEGE